mgnify:CR=1 FL=1
MTGDEARRGAKDLRILEDLYEHTVDVILRAEALGGWKSLDEARIFEVEYWDLEQAKLKKGGKPPAFAGEVALVTGAASGIGKAAVASLMARGAAVLALDLDAKVEAAQRRQALLHLSLQLLLRRPLHPHLGAARAHHESGDEHL